MHRDGINDATCCDIDEKGAEKVKIHATANGKSHFIVFMPDRRR